MTMMDQSNVCRSLSPTRRVGDFPIANVSLSEHRHLLVGGSELKAHPDAWLSPHDFQVFLASDRLTMVDTRGTPLVWKGNSPDTDSQLEVKDSFLIVHPWDLLRANEQHVSGLTENSIEGNVHPLAIIEGVVRIGAGTRILPGVFIEGNVVIGSNCKIGPNCYIRGNTSIGDGCHIGQSVEIKNCLILSKTNVGHLSYVGDSVLGEKVNFGAGTTTSNLRHDGNNHRATVDGTLIDTGRRKFGAIVGDRVHTGINTSIYPGRQLWPDTTTVPGEIVRKDVVS